LNDWLNERWDEMGRCSIVKHNILYKIFFFFILLFSIALGVVLLQIRKNELSIKLSNSVIHVYYKKKSHCYISRFLHRISSRAWVWVRIHTLQCILYGYVCMYVCVCVIVDEPWQIGSFIVLNYTIDRIFCRTRERNDSWPCRV
jgi:hypothetical protein